MSDNRISKEDVRDDDFVDAVELASDGYSVSYRTVSLVSTTAASRDVVISTPTAIDRLDNVDEPLQVGDVVEIQAGMAIGMYTVELIVDPLSTFRTVEPISDSVGNSADFYHPAGATKIGVYTSNIQNSSAQNLQKVLEDLDASIDTHASSTANPHSTSITNIGSGTLAQLNAAVSDATLDNSSASRTPTAHAASHQNAGSDEISIAGLSGLLADPQTPAAHTHTHASTTGITADDHHNQQHLITSGIDHTFPGGTSTFLRGDGTFATPVGTGDVVGPGSSVNNTVPRFDGVTGKLIQGSGVAINDLNYLSSERYIMGGGPDLSLIPVESGQSVVTSWHGMQLVGNKQSSVNYTPTNIGSANQFGIIVPSQDTNADASFAIVAAVGQTGDLFRVTDNSLSALISVDINGNIVFSGSQTVDGVDVSNHSGRHENGGADEISVAGLSGLLADPQTPATHTHTHASTTGQTADDHHNQSHAFGGTDHTISTLANVNALISDATLDDSSDSRTPSAHTIVSHSDTTATGFELNILTGGGGTSLHTHTHASTTGQTANDHHNQQHPITSGTDHTFPGGVTDFLRADGTFATPAGGSSGTTFVIWAEENSSLGNNTYEWAFGNGDDTLINGGVVIPITCECYALTLNMDGGGSATVSLEVNGVNVSQIVSVTNDAFITIGAPIAIAAGDRINFKTIIGAGSSIGNRVAAFFRADIAGVAGANEITVRKNTAGVDIGTRRRLNFIEGTNVTMTIADDGIDDEIDITINAAGGGVSDHGLLSGLTDDDHIQYLLVNGTRAMSGNIDMGLNQINNVGNIDGRDVSADGTSLDNHIASTANPHSTSITNIGSGTLAQLNTAVSDATLDDSSSARTPTAHTIVSHDTSATGAELDVLTNGSNADTLHSHINDVISLYMSSSGVTFTTTPVTVAYDQSFVNTNNSIYSNASGEVTISESGTFMFSIDVSINLVSNGRVTSVIYLEVDSGTGFFEVIGTRSYGYHRLISSDENTPSINIALPVFAGAVYRVMAVRQSGSQTLGFLNNASRFTITRLSK